MKEDILIKALERLSELTGVSFDYLRLNSRQGHNVYDAEITLQRDRIFTEWKIEIKKKVTNAILPKLYSQQEQIYGSGSFMVVAEYIAPGTRKSLVDKHIAYLDCSGNAHIDHPQLFIHIDTRKTIDSEKSLKDRAFSKTGIKVLYSLLSSPDLLHQPYRSIADHANVSLDTISKVINSLLENRYLLKVTKYQYKIQDREELISKWVEGYNAKLKPSLFQRRYRSTTRDVHWRNLNIDTHTDKWGGANGADVLTQYLHSDVWLLYTEKSSREIRNSFNWLPDNEGPIYVYQKFWKSISNKQSAPPLIVYADLLNSHDSRYIEAAQMIYTQYLKDGY